MVKERAVAEPPVIPILSKIRTYVRKMLSMQGLAKHFVVAKSVILDQAACGNLRRLESGEFPPYQKPMAKFDYMEAKAQQ
jgi:hypothetical protein